MEIKLEIKIFEYFKSNKLYVFFVAKYQVIYHQKDNQMLFQKNKLPRFTYKKKSNISFDKIIHHLINNLILEMID